MNRKATARTRLFAVAHGVICAVPAGILATIIGGGFSPILSLILSAFWIGGNAKYGPRHMNNAADLKAGLIASATWPYLFWKELDRRFQEPSDTTYDALVNGVFVGALSDADYSAIKRQVLRDPRVYLAQILNAGWVALRAFDSFVVGIPMLAFWGMVLLAYFEPEVYGAVLLIVQQGPGAIREAVGKYLSLAVQLWVFALIAQAVMLRTVAGFENKFSQAITRRLRQKLKVAADGNVELTATIDVAAARQAA